MATFRPLKNGKCVCDAAKDKAKECTCPRRENYYVQFRDNQGKQILRKTPFTARKDAERFEDGLLKGLASERKKEVWDFFESMRSRRAVCSIGDLCAAVLGSADKFRKTAGDGRRPANDLRLVIAHAKGLWTTESRSTHAHWKRLGTKPRPDEKRIDALSSSVLDGALVKAYYAAKSEDGVVDWVEAREGNISINSTLRHARDMFRGRVRLAIEGLVLDEAKLKTFLEMPALPEPSLLPDPVVGEVYQKMVEEGEKVKKSGVGVWLANVAFRQTGMRAGSVLHLHQSWLRVMADGAWVDVKMRKGGTAEYSLPISQELRELLEASATGYLLPGADEGERAEVIQAHNDWLKGIIGGTGERKQGAHRLRDTAAGITWALWGPEVAAEVLGHADVKTTRKHYSRLRLDVTPLMKRECAELARLRAPERDRA